MNRIDSMFAELKKQNKKALITFITAGDPDFDTTEQLVLEMERQGANLIELGVPFSDPIAEGPIIQEEMCIRDRCHAINHHGTDRFHPIEEFHLHSSLLWYIGTYQKFHQYRFCLPL